MKNLWVWSFENFQSPGTSSSPGFKNLWKKTNCFHEKISKENWQFYRKLFDQFLVFWEPWLYIKNQFYFIYRTVKICYKTSGIRCPF